MDDFRQQVLDEHFIIVIVIIITIISHHYKPTPYHSGAIGRLDE
jgi:hypothetical protein